MVSKAETYVPQLGSYRSICPIWNYASKWGIRVQNGWVPL